MAFNVPTSGQYITFPLDIQKFVQVEWSENMIKHRAVYFVTRCFWGPLTGDKRVPDRALPATTVTKGQPAKPADPGTSKLGKPVAEKTKTVIARGSTDLYIASEYFDEAYRGGPLGDYHIKDLFEKEKWATMKLNESFHYGQNGQLSNLRRFIVYHPVNAPGIFQHRFSGLKVDEYVKTAGIIAKELPAGLAGEVTGLIDRAMDFCRDLFEILKANIGDFLHQFLDEAEVEEAQKKWREHVNAHPNRTAVEMKAREKVVTEYDGALKSVFSKLSSEEKGSMNAVDLANYKVKALDEADMYLLILQDVEFIKGEKNRLNSPEQILQRWQVQVERLIRRELPGVEAALKKQLGQEITAYLDKVKDGSGLGDFLRTRTTGIAGWWQDKAMGLSDSQKDLVQQVLRESSWRMDVFRSLSGEVKAGIAMQAGANQFISVREAREQFDQGLRRSNSDPNLREQQRKEDWKGTKGLVHDALGYGERRETQEDRNRQLLRPLVPQKK